jgi:tRNA-2-methylthio-N6-dimethylallyladenosine synthase
MTQADLIIVNTCTVRAKAEQKAFSFLGRLAPIKAQKPELIIGIGGCVAQQEGRNILSRMPYVDLVFGTHAISRLTEHIHRITTRRCRVVDVQLAQTLTPEDFTTGPMTSSDISAFVTIMRGCDNYCTYCVVPYVRGRESSRPIDEIINEIKFMVDNGVREITLLGQNVNSYGRKDGNATFYELLKCVNAIDGLERIRFTTSHPKDLSAELIRAFGHLEKLCPHIHLPVQSGSDKILKRMNRHYGRQHYLEKIDQLRLVCPDIAITSDIIVGFPGETDADFQLTMDLIRRVTYDGLFAFIYSDRPNAPASRFDNKIDDVLKKERLQQVLACQEEFTIKKNRALIGSVQPVLVDGLSKQLAEPLSDVSTNSQWSGRTNTNKIVHFLHESCSDNGNQILTGRIMEIMIERAMSHSLWGRIKSQSNIGPSGKGVNAYAS